MPDGQKEIESKLLNLSYHTLNYSNVAAWKNNNYVFL